MTSEKITKSVQAASWIRKMFESGEELKQKIGEENVYDFSLGNPYLNPPLSLETIWIDYLKSKQDRKHSYTANAGLKTTREFLAKKLQEIHLLPFLAEDVVLCCGAAGGLNVVFHSLLNEQEEVLVSNPYFPEYFFYAQNHLGVLKVAKSKKNFQLDLEQIEKNITEKTKIVLLNSPNNPTGVVYSKESIQGLSKILKKNSSKQNRIIYLVSDEPYAKILYDDLEHHSIFESYENSILVTSHSKDLSLAGERIGYLAVHPAIQKKELLLDALIFSNRTLGFVNAPVSMQAILPKIFDLQLDYGYYLQLRDFFYQSLTKIGYSMVKPQGAFYFFPESLEKDDIAFVKKALQFGILLVPGSGFGCKGHFRLSYAVDKKVAQNSITAFQKLFDYYKNEQ